MRGLALNIILILFLAAVFSVIVVFLHPRSWDAAVVLLTVLIYIKKSPQTVFIPAVIGVLFFETISNTPPGVQLFAFFSAFLTVYFLKNQFLKLNQKIAFVFSVAAAGLVFRLTQIFSISLMQNQSESFFQVFAGLFDAPSFAAAFLWNVFFSLVFIAAYNAGKKRLSGIARD